MSTPAVQSSLPALFFTDEMPRVYPTVFVYAIAGAGKTNLLRTLRPYYEPLVLASEYGNTKGMTTLGDQHIAAIMLNTLEQLVAVTTELRAKSKPGELYYQGKGPFTALGLDSLTGVGVFLENAIKQLKGWDMIWDNAPGARKDPRSAYPYIAERGRQVVAKLMDLPVPLVLLCREGLMTEGEGEEAKTYAAPEMPGQKLPRELPGWPEATLRLKMLNGKRVMVTENEGDVIARVRLPEGKRLPKFVKPDIGTLLQVLQGKYELLDQMKIDTSVPKTPQQLAAEERQRQATAAPPSVVK